MKKVFSLFLCVFVCIGSATCKKPNSKGFEDSQGRPLKSVYELRSNAVETKAEIALLRVSETYGVDSIQHIKKLLEDHGHKVLDIKAAPSNDEQIRTILSKWIKQKVSVIIVIGGTGLSHKNTTTDIVRSLTNRSIPGFGQLFCELTWKRWGILPNGRGIPAITNRAYAGLAKGTIIFVVPGSPDSVDLALNKLILHELPHLVDQISVNKDK